METKICCTCKEEKEFSEFHRNKLTKDGLQTSCKMCKSYLAKINRFNNPEIFKERSKLWRKNNPIKNKIKNDNWKNNNKDRYIELTTIWRNENKERHRLTNRKLESKNISNLSDRYIKHKLISKGILNKDITPELIEVQRLIIKTKRLCKTSQN